MRPNNSTDGVVQFSMSDITGICFDTKGFTDTYGRGVGTGLGWVQQLVSRVGSSQWLE